jgi:hypothetical protein
MPSIQSVNVTNSKNIQDENVIKVALYECGSSFNERQFISLCNYEWEKNNKTFRFEATVIDNDDVIGSGSNPLTNENFDVFIIGASAKSYLIDGLNDKWKSNVQNFVANGGGYIGVCGGANAASQGFQTATNAFHRQVNKGVLGLANVYINDYFLGEWQYLMKFGFNAFLMENVTNTSYPSYPNVITSVEKNQKNEIFSTYKNNLRYISYAGGPGMYNASLNDPKLGPIIPLLRYAEELMHSKPIHYWRPTIGGWQIHSNVSTNLLNKFAGLATTYNSNGRVVLYGPHPEYPFVVIDGYIKEYYGRGYMSSHALSKQYVYNYFGKLLNFSYNAWIIRRSMAWAAHVSEEDLPPISETCIWLNQPRTGKGDANGRIFGIRKPVLVGSAYISGRLSEDIEKVEFYLDDVLKFVANDKPFEWLWDEKSYGKHVVKVIAYDNFGNKAYDSMEVLKFL